MCLSDYSGSGVEARELAHRFISHHRFDNTCRHCVSIENESVFVSNGTRCATTRYALCASFPVDLIVDAIERDLYDARSARTDPSWALERSVTLLLTFASAQICANNSRRAGASRALYRANLRCSCGAAARIPRDLKVLDGLVRSGPVATLFECVQGTPGSQGWSGEELKIGCSGPVAQPSFRVRAGDSRVLGWSGAEFEVGCTWACSTTRF